ncbi:MAG: AAA family ATPase [Xanthomonadaceae bacterium]|nr:AAA family ATPase [Xanthomonadaceae bacterium]
MTLSRLDIQDFRNLASARLDFSPRCNLITGDNAAGKTSLLEAIHVLARLRSFRTQRLETLIREGAEAFQLVARLEESYGSGMRLCWHPVAASTKCVVPI